jgi:hypothetical protein
VQSRLRGRARGRVFPVRGLARAGLSPLLFIPFLFCFSTRLSKFIEISIKMIKS